MSPYGFTCGSVQHRPHHFIKGLVGVASQGALSIFVDKAPTESWAETSSVFPSEVSV